MRCALLLLLVLGSSGGGSPEAEKLAAWRSRHQAAFPPAAPQPAAADDIVHFDLEDDSDAPSIARGGGGGRTTQLHAASPPADAHAAHTGPEVPLERQQSAGPQTASGDEKHCTPRHASAGFLQDAGGGYVIAQQQQEFMLWWLPVGGMYEAGDKRDGHQPDSSGRIMLYSPLHSSKHGKGKFLLDLRVPPFSDDDACVTALLDSSTWLYVNARRDDQLSLEFEASAGWHDLTLALQTTGTGRRQADLFCRQNADDLVEPPMVVIHVSFEVFQERLEEVEINHTLPPMAETCSNVFSRRIQHLCRPSPSPASDISVLLRISAWKPDSGRPASSGEGGDVGVVKGDDQGRGGRRINKGDYESQCFHLQAFAIDNFNNMHAAAEHAARSTAAGPTWEQVSSRVGVRVVGLVSPDSCGGVSGGESKQHDEQDSVIVVGDGRASIGCFPGDDFVVGEQTNVTRWVVVEQVRWVKGVIEEDGIEEGHGDSLEGPKAQWQAIESTQFLIQLKGFMGGEEVGKDTRDGNGMLSREKTGIAGKALVTVVANMDYLVGALVLFHSVNDACSRDGGEVAMPYANEDVDLVLLVSTRLLGEEKRVRSLAHQAGVRLKWVAPIDSPHTPLNGRKEMTETYTKIHVFNLTEYAQVVFLDADVLVYKCELLRTAFADYKVKDNELFIGGCPTGPAPKLSVTGSLHLSSWVVKITTWIMILRPDKERFEFLFRNSGTAESFDGTDMGLLETLIPSHTLLPPNLVAWRRTAMSYKSLWLDRLRPVFALDFTGRPKPWQQGSLATRVDAIDNGNYVQLNLEWWSAFYRMTSTLPPLGCIEQWGTSALDPRLAGSIA